MSAGNKIYKARLPEDLMELIVSTINRRNGNTTEPPWTFSDFVRIALLEKVKKHERGRRDPSRCYLQKLEFVLDGDRIELADGSQSD